MGYLSNKSGEDFSQEELRKIGSYFDKIITIVTKSSHKINKTNKEPVNKRIQKQVRFESTKKPRQRRQALHLATPTASEKDNIIQGLLNEEIENLHSEFDHTY